jgi:hypothetical protein
MFVEAPMIATITRASAAATAKSQVSSLTGRRGRGRGAAKGGFRRTMGCAEQQDGLLSSVLLQLLLHQSSPGTRGSGVESQVVATIRAHVLGLGVAHLPGVGGGDELEGCGFNALVWFVSFFGLFFVCFWSVGICCSHLRCPSPPRPRVSHVPSPRCPESCRRDHGCAGPSLRSRPVGPQTPGRRDLGGIYQARCGRT